MKTGSIGQIIPAFTLLAVETLGIFDAVGDVKETVIPVEVHSMRTLHAGVTLEEETALAVGTDK